MEVNIMIIRSKDKQPDRSGTYLIWYEWGTFTSMEYDADHGGWNLLEDGDRSFEAFPAFWADIPVIREINEVAERKYEEAMNG